MCESQLIHLAADLSHYHTDYLWKMPGSWEGYPYYSSPEFYEDRKSRFNSSRGNEWILRNSRHPVDQVFPKPSDATMRSGRAD